MALKELFLPAEVGTAFANTRIASRKRLVLFWRQEVEWYRRRGKVGGGGRPPSSPSQMGFRRAKPDGSPFYFRRQVSDHWMRMSPDPVEASSIEPPPRTLPRSSLELIAPWTVNGWSTVMRPEPVRA